MDRRLFLKTAALVPAAVYAPSLLAAQPPTWKEKVEAKIEELRAQGLWLDWVAHVEVHNADCWPTRGLQISNHKDYASWEGGPFRTAYLAAWTDYKWEEFPGEKKWIANPPVETALRPAQLWAEEIVLERLSELAIMAQGLSHEHESVSDIGPVLLDSDHSLSCNPKERRRVVLHASQKSWDTRLRERAAVARTRAEFSEKQGG